MELTTLTFQVIAICYLAIGISTFSGQLDLEKIYKDLLKDQTILLFGATFGIIIGMLIIRHHNVWVLDWPVIVTFIGWAALIKGIVILAAPAHLSFYAPLFQKKYLKLLSVFMILFGLLTGYLGFLA